MTKPPSKFQKSCYSRNLPHLQGSGQPLFVTFRTVLPTLPELVRDDVLEHCLHDQGKKPVMRCAIDMPDHVHLLFWPKRDGAGVPYALAEVMNGIKGASAHTVNRLLGRRGRVWQDESFDHVVRKDECLLEKVGYVADNPVRKAICKTRSEYRWYWSNCSLSNYV